MSNNKQSSIEWLWEIAYNRELTVEDWKQAKEMHQEEIDQSYRDGFEFALINECAKQSTSEASKYAEGYSEGYKRALELTQWTISNLVPPSNETFEGNNEQAMIDYNKMEEESEMDNYNEMKDEQQ